MTPAIVLAAGASTRMGRPKALLEAGDRTFIRRFWTRLRDGGRPGRRGRGPAGTAGGGRRGRRRPDSGGPSSIPRADEGQLSSLLAGLDAIDGPASTRRS